VRLQIEKERLIRDSGTKSTRDQAISTAAKCRTSLKTGISGRTLNRKGGAMHQHHGRGPAGHRGVLQHRRPQLQERMIHIEHDEWFYRNTDQQFPGKFNTDNNLSMRPSIITQRLDYYSWKVLPISKSKGFFNENRHFIPEGAVTTTGFVFSCKSFLVELFPITVRNEDSYFFLANYNGIVASKDIINGNI
jgi:hypothetical protein